MIDLKETLKKIIDNKSDYLVKEYERDLSYARKIQMSLIPDDFPETEKYRFYGKYLPADLIGGDLFDIKVIDEKYVIFYIADVVGHGVGAAMLTVFVKQSIEMTSTLYGKPIINSPKQVLEKLNKKMIETDFEGNPQVTIFYSILDVENLLLTYSSAGHHPSIIVREKNSEPILIGKNSMPVGWVKDLNLYEENIELKEKDKIILFTDGIFEFENKKNIDESFLNFVNKIIENREYPINKLIKNIIDEYEDSIKEKQEDDVAILGVEIKEFKRGE
jgi:sigma-B regulation protein RsbU (phosphoserine phosphatase)